MNQPTNQQDAIERQNAATEAIIKKYDGKLPREVFDFILSTIMANAQVAFNAAKGLSILSCTARDIARQRRMNQMVENGVIMLEELCNVTICCVRNETVNTVPFPLRIDANCYKQTMMNFENNR